MTLRQHNRCARHRALQLGKGDDGAREGNGANRGTQRHLHEACRVNMAVGIHNAESFWRQKRGPSHQHSGQADERVKGSHKLGHVRHGDATCRHRSDKGTNADTGCDNAEAFHVFALQQKQCGGDGNRHTHHTKIVTLARCLWRRQATQRQNKEYARGEIK